MRGLRLVLAVGLMWGCARLTTPEAPPADRLADELVEVDREFDVAVARGDRAAFADLIATDAVFLGTDTLRGRSAVVQSWDPLLDREGSVSLRWSPASAVVATSGDLAYTLGTYRLERRGQDGRVQAATGDYVTVWRRDPDGRRRAVVDSGTPPRWLEESQTTPTQ